MENIDPKCKLPQRPITTIKDEIGQQSEQSKEPH